MPQRYYNRSGDITAPADDAYPITPNNSLILDTPFRSLYVGVSGDISLQTLMNTNVTFASVQAGSILVIRGVRVNATGTTANSIVGLV